MGLRPATHTECHKTGRIMETQLPCLWEIPGCQQSEGSRNTSCGIKGSLRFHGWRKDHDTSLVPLGAIVKILLAISSGGTSRILIRRENQKQAKMLAQIQRTGKQCAP